MTMAANPSSIAAVQEKATSKTIEQFEYRFGPTDAKTVAEATARAGPRLIFPQTAGVYGALHHDALTHSWMDDNGRTMRSISPSELALTPAEYAASKLNQQAPRDHRLAKAQAPSTYNAGAFKEYYGQDPEIVARRAEAAGMGRGAPWYDVGSTHEYSLYQEGAEDKPTLWNTKSMGCILMGAGAVGVLVALGWFFMDQTPKRKTK